MSKNTITSLVIVGVIFIGAAALIVPPLLNSDSSSEVSNTENTALAKNYFEYSEDKLTSDKTNVLFFHATWCPTCTAAENDIKQKDSLPEDINLLRVNYDTAQDLREKYGVTGQSTYIKVDENGTKIDSAQGFTKVEDIVDWALGSTSTASAEPENMLETNTEMMQKDVAPASTASIPSGRYIEYSNAVLQEEGYESHVLFFNASWCPACKKTEADLNNNLNSLPNGVQVLKVDYDSNLDLRKQYGVTSQHTFVQVDANGNQINKKLGLSTTQDIVDFIS